MPSLVSTIKVGQGFSVDEKLRLLARDLQGVADGTLLADSGVDAGTYDGAGMTITVDTTGRITSISLAGSGTSDQFLLMGA